MKKQIYVLVILSSLFALPVAYAIQMSEPSSCSGQSDNTYNPNGDNAGGDEQKDDSGDHSQDATG